MDCSGLTCAIYKDVYNVQLSRRSADQLKKDCYRIRRSKLQEGDLVFFTTPGSGKKCGHVGIYLKGDRFIHASTSRGVMVSSLNESFWDKHWLCGGQSHRRKR